MKKMMNIYKRCIVFDLDDTLYPEISFVYSGFRAVSQYISSKTRFSEKEIFEILKKIFTQVDKRARTFNELLDILPKLKDLFKIDELISIYRDHQPSISLLPEMNILIKKLRENEIAIAILTDGYLDVQKKKINALRLSNMVDEIIYTDLWGREYWKPNIRGFQVIMERFNECDEFWYIGDNPVKDFKAPNLLGWYTVRLKWDFQIHNNKTVEEDGMEAHYVFSFWNDFTRFLEQKLKIKLNIHEEERNE
jgi:putative hydrolase of the HAD superfamily